MAINDRTALEKIRRISENAPEMNIETAREEELNELDNAMTEIYYIAQAQCEKANDTNTESDCVLTVVVNPVCPNCLSEMHTGKHRVYKCSNCSTEY